MNSRHRHQLKIKALQKEQVQLVQIENILTNLLGKVNESVNELKVEELQIKSTLVEQYTSNLQDEQPTTSAKAATARSLLLNTDPENTTMDREGIEVINKQMLALESLLVPLKQKHFADEEEEEDDDDDEDDDYVPSEDDD